MSAAQLEGMWLNVHIRELLEERDAHENKNGVETSTRREEKVVDEKVGVVEDGDSHTKDATLDALNSSLAQAKKMVEAAQKALDEYKSLHPRLESQDVTINVKGAVRENGVGSRELSGEMGGDTRENQ